MTKRFKRVVLGSLDTAEYRIRGIRRLQDSLNDLADDVADVRTVTENRAPIQNITENITQTPVVLPPNINIQPPPVIPPPVILDAGPFGLVFEFGDGLTVPAVGTVSGELEVDIPSRIIRSIIVSKNVGSAVVNIEAAAFADPPVWRSIVGLTPPTLISQAAIRDNVLQDWNKVVLDGVLLRATLLSVTSCLKVTTTLKLLRGLQ